MEEKLPASTNDGSFLRLHAAGGDARYFAMRVLDFMADTENPCRRERVVAALAQLKDALDGLEI